MKMQIVFLGAPGSGKGTQAGLLKNDYSFEHLSTGDLLRGEIKKGSELGKKVDGVLKSGELVSDELVIDLLKANCSFKQSQYIFDGFPRTLEQAKALTNLFNESNVKDYLGIFFNIDIEKLVKRLENRRTCPNCGRIYNLETLPPKVNSKCDACPDIVLTHRDDDKGDVIRKRIEVYNASIKPICDYYKNNKKLFNIDVQDDINAVYQDLKKILGL